MAFPCFVLGRGSSSQTFIGVHQIGGGADVDTVVHATQNLVSGYYKWESDAIGIELYKPIRPLGITENAKLADLAEKLLGTVSDEYLRGECSHILSRHTMDSATPGCFIAIATFAIEFTAFGYVGNDEPPSLVKVGWVSGLPNEITKLTQASAWKATERRLETQGRGILSVDVYETECTRETIERDPPTVASRRPRRLLTMVGHEGLAPSGKGCLFVELKTEKYIYFDCVMFKKMAGQRCTFIGTGVVKGFPYQTLKVVEDYVRHYVEEDLLDWDAAANAHVSIYEPRGELEGKTPQDLESLQFTEEDIDSDLQQMAINTKLDRSAETLVIIITTRAPARPLETIPEEGNGISREAIAALARQRESPSAGSKLSTLLITQHDRREDAVYNHRPHTLTGPPVQIYNPAFITFIREMSYSCTTVEFSDVELEKALDFIDVSLSFYEDGSRRRAKIHELRALGRLISPKIYSEPRVIKPDGTTTVISPTNRQEAVVRIVEMKNEIGEGGSDPIAQAECGFVLICSSQKYLPFKNASCCPMFLVGVAGPHLTVSGAVFAERFVSQRFTDYIYLGPLPTSQGRSALDHSIRRVAQVLRALNRATDELADYYSRLEFTLPPTPKPHGSLHHPNFDPPPIPLHPIPSGVVPPSFQEYTVGGETYKVDYGSRLVPSSPSRAVFKGTVMRSGDQTKYNVVIKFTATYCKDAHQKLAEMGRAPHLWFCERVESVGMHVVVMDHEDGVCGYARLVDREHVEQLRTAVRTLHDDNYVHGDIREPNVLVTTGGLKLIDFDWCEKAGKARYPADISLDSSLGWHDGVRRGGLIAKEHDEHMFKLLTGLPYVAQDADS